MFSQSSILKFVLDKSNGESGQSTYAGALTSDHLIYLSIIIFLIALVCCLVFLFLFSKKQSFVINKHNVSKTLKTINFARVKIALLVFFVLIAGTMIFTTAIKCFAASDIYTNNYYNAIIYENNSVVVEDIIVCNNSENSEYNFAGISTENLGLPTNCKLKISSNETVLYESNVGDKKIFDDGVIIAPHSSLTLKISCEIDVNKAREIVGLDAIKINFMFSSDTNGIYGVLENKKILDDTTEVVSPCEGIEIGLYNTANGLVKKTISDCNGYYNFFVEDYGEYYIKPTSLGIKDFSQKVIFDKQLVHKDSCASGLDFYTVEELKHVANTLSDLKTKGDDVLQSSKIYKEFDSYIGGENNKESVWYSNSNGKQSENQLDANKCNQAYKCNFSKSRFVKDNELDQFLFVRILGICHDYDSNTKKYAGLTFQTIHALPIAQCFDEKGTHNYWGEDNEDKFPIGTLKTDLSENGKIYESINEKIRNNFINVDKGYNWSHGSDVNHICYTSDKVFLLAYSEICENTPSERLIFDKTWFCNKVPRGNEGYLYEFFKRNKIKGGGNTTEEQRYNKVLDGMELTNSLQYPADEHFSYSWLRSTNVMIGTAFQYARSLYMRDGAIDAVFFSDGDGDAETGCINPCFCF